MSSFTSTAAVGATAAAVGATAAAAGAAAAAAAATVATVATVTAVATDSYRNNPHKVLECHVPLGKDITDLEFVEEVKVATTTIVDNWHSSDRDNLVISTLSGGITNALYIVENTKCNEKVIVRVFGVGTDLFIDRGIENEVFAYLSSHEMVWTSELNTNVTCYMLHVTTQTYLLETILFMLLITGTYFSRLVC
jgi:hypothetical protein